MQLAPLALAYFGTGVVLVAKDFLQPRFNRPGYIADRRYVLATGLVALWLPWTLRMFVGYGSRAGWSGVRKYLKQEAGLLYLVFVGAWVLLEFLIA